MTDQRKGSNAFQASKTHCKFGHEYTPANTKVISTPKRGGGLYLKRQCRKCKAIVGKRLRDATRLAKRAANGVPAAPFPAMRCDPVIRETKHEAGNERRRARRIERAAEKAPETLAQPADQCEPVAEIAHHARPRLIAETAPPPPRRRPRPFERLAVEFLTWREAQEVPARRGWRDRAPVQAQ